ncbi:MAG: thioredoxin family protein [Rubripirellula sp.]
MKRIMVLVGLGILLVCFRQTSLLAEMPNVGDPSLRQPSAARPLISWHRSLETGWEESRRRNVPMVIYITTERCTYCDAMKRDTWCDQTVQQDLANGFVAIALSQQENSATLDRIKVTTYPTTLIGVPQGKIVAHRTGYQPAVAMKSLLRDIKGRVLNR